MLKIREGRLKDQCYRLWSLKFSLQTTYFRFTETYWLNIQIPGPHLRPTKFSEVGTKNTHFNKFFTSSYSNLEDFNYNSVFLIILYYFSLGGVLVDDSKVIDFLNYKYNMGLRVIRILPEWKSAFESLSHCAVICFHVLKNNE